MFGDSLFEELDIRNEEIVADELNFVAELLRQFLPTIPIVFRAAIFDRNDRKLRAEFGVVIDQLRGGFLRAVGFFEDVGIFFAIEKFRRSWIKRDKNFFA